MVDGIPRERHCCLNCGFLTYRDHLRQLAEAMTDDRKREHGPPAPADHRFPICPPLFCFTGSFDLVGEVEDWAETNREAIAEAKKRKEAPLELPVYRNERNCKRFTPYIQGLSPREHYEELRMERERNADSVDEERRHREMLDVMTRTAIIGVLGTIIGALLGWFTAIFSAK